MSPLFRGSLPMVAGCFLMVATVSAEVPGHVTGVGGIFMRSDRPEALMAGYRDMLGLRIEAWGGVLLRVDAPGHPPVLTLNAVGRDSDHMAPSAREFMINLAVDDLPAMLARLKAKDVAVLGEDNSDAHGRFAWILDPDGTKIELWQPGPTPAG